MLDILNPLRYYIAGILLVAAIGAGLAWKAGIERRAFKAGQAEVNGRWATEREAQKDAALREATANAAETLRRLERQKANQDAQDVALAAARADAARAGADADRVRAQAAEAAREWSARLSDSPTASDSAAAGAAIGVCADVLGRAIAHARLLASTADAARAAGLKCSADYEALIPDKP